MAEMKNLTINGEQFTLPFAPAGYGLGVQGSKYITSWAGLDSAVENGWYYLSPGEVKTVNGVPVNTALVHVKGHDGYHVRQELYPVGTNTVLVRMANARVFGEWECENPPMELGVEYRTTERWNGKAVYVKAVDLGALPNATSAYISINVSGITGAVDCIPTFRNTETGDKYTGLITEVDKVFFAGYGTVMIKTNTDARKFTAVAACKYTKD